METEKVLSQLSDNELDKIIETYKKVAVNRGGAEALQVYMLEKIRREIEAIGKLISESQGR